MKALGANLNRGQSGLLIIILALGALLTLKAGHHVDRLTGQGVNNFLNVGTLIQVGTDTSLFAIMAVGMTMVIVSGGIDLSVGSIFALCEVTTSLVLRAMPGIGPAEQLVIAIGICCGLGLLCGWLNGVMVSTLGVHPFIITLGTMWVYRGVAFVTSKAESILVPESLTHVAKANLGLRHDLYPVPMLVMIVVAIIGQLYLQNTTFGRRIFAVGGNIQASKYAGLKVGNILIGVYALSGLTAGIAAFIGCSFFGSASSGDANGYELYVIAGAVVGGASLSGGRGSAMGALFGALLIVMIRQAIRTLGLDQNYEWIIIGVAIVVAVVLDRFNANLAKRRLVSKAPSG